ncbi:hypothetical protein AOC36_01800 [Erysipelothrix larvae]|uniref:Glycosyl transferase family 1 domain-containing protein n=1 Tax=Erysipelothrix larvae TaxID=1514105 RepID=A0A109UGK5_9FIRM|nr:glycosyltransferase [Erysipelothrix larvae]AMC92763.1 hypothetical protein AOC36_01800 [Erysipelothrix larvae]
MKLLMFTNTVFKIGGVARVVTSLANEWVNYYDVTIVNTHPGYSPERKLYKIDPRIKIHHDPELYIHDQNFRLTQASKNKLHAYLKHEAFDVIIGVEGKQSIALADALEGIDARKISWFHNSYEGYFENKGRFLWKKNDRFKQAMGAYDHLIVLTHHDKKRFDEAFNLESTVILNPMPFRGSKSTPVFDYKRILTVGRIKQPTKGLDLAVEALIPVFKKHPDWTWHVVGNGPDTIAIETMVRNLGIERHVVFYGAHRHVKTFYKHASIFLLPSRWEGLPMVSLEAMSYGLPIVGYDIDALKEVVGSALQKEVLAPQCSIEGLTEKVLSLVEDEAHWNYVSKLIQQRSNHFSFERVMFEWDCLFKD